MKRSSSVARAAALGGLVLAHTLAGCETKPTPPGPSVVNETGYLTASSIHYTADGPLDDGVHAITLLGAAGAVSRSGGELSVNDEDAVTVRDPEGTFVLTTSGSLNDTLELRYRLDDQLSQLTLQLDHPLSAFLVQGAGDSSDGGFGNPAAHWLQATEQPGSVRVTQLVDPPYLVYNAERGLVVRVDDADSVELQADPGEVICVAQLDPETETATTSDCAPAPEPTP